jgi:uncharacterized protein (TIRG00374 family)
LSQQRERTFINETRWFLDTAVPKIQVQEMTRSSVKKILILTIRIGALVVLVALALRNADISLLTESLNLKMLVAIVLLQPLAIISAYFVAKRYSVLLDSPKIDMKSAFKAIVLAGGLNVLLPARVSEVLKAAYINEKTGYPVSRAASAVILERIGDVLVLVLLALASVGSLVFHINAVVVSGIGLLMISILVLLAYSEDLTRLIAGRLRNATVSRFLQQFLSHAAGSLKSRVFYIGHGYGVLAWVSSFLLVGAFVLLAGSIKLDAAQTLLLFTATTAGLLIPLLPGGIGTFEAAGVYVLTGLGYGFAEALMLSVGLHVCQLLFSFSASLFILTTEKTGIGALARKLRAAAVSPAENDFS